MKAALSTQLGQQLHLTPQLLQSIRLLQLDGLHLEQEIQRLLDSNPLLEIEEAEAPAADATEVSATTLETAAFDELPESSMWDVAGASWQDGDDDRMARIAAGESTDPQLRVLQRLALDMDDRELAVAAFWLDHCDEAGYLQAPLAQLQLLAAHDYPALARQHDAEIDDVREAVRLILSLQPRPGDSLLPERNAVVVPDVLAWHADGQWKVALNPATSRRVSINSQYEQALAETSEAAPALREMLQEARWFSRGLSMRYDTLLRTARVIVERQAAFLVRGEEAMAPLTLKEVAEEIGMHESTVSRITTGKFLQTPRGTFELKHFFAVRLEGASVSGQAVKAMVRRLIDAEPAGRPLADEAIAGLLSRQGVNIARRTVAKYREQLDIAPARERRRLSARQPQLARVG